MTLMATPDDIVDGPDVDRAREVKDHVKTVTVEVEVILQEQRALAKRLTKVGKRNHFADKFRAILRGDE